MVRQFTRLAAACLALAVVGTCAASGCAVPADADPAPPLPAVGRITTVGIEGRIAQATRAAADRGAEVSIAFLDRQTGRRLDNGDHTPIATASVAKLFIADDLLFRESLAEITLSDDERVEIESMLASSDDAAANDLWYRYGTSDIVDRTAARYGLTDTTAPYDDQWWNTETTAADLITYYSELLDGRGGLDNRRTATIVDFLHGSTPRGVDGYDQRFGIPDGLPDEHVRAVKQGWMCCVADRWIHLSTGVIGADNRYVLVTVAREDIHYEDDEQGYPDTALTDVTDDNSARHARDTLTDVVTMMFPDRRIDRDAR